MYSYTVFSKCILFPDGVPAKVPSTPKSALRRQSLVATALMNSARKAVQSAQKIRSKSTSTPVKTTESRQKASDDGETLRKRTEPTTVNTPLCKENEDMEPVADKKVCYISSLV